VADARALAQAGVFSIVLECVPGELAKVLTGAVEVPTIGIGAGPDCDGQVLVTNDLLGLYEKFTPTFVKKYLDLASQIKEAVLSYREEVVQGIFPAEEHTFGSDRSREGTGPVCSL
jgi:3-methyl-2-oxobutanoate hydroxymethyltransferase